MSCKDCRKNLSGYYPCGDDGCPEESREVEFERYYEANKERERYQEDYGFELYNILWGDL